MFNNQWKWPLAAALKNNQPALRSPLSGSPPSCFTFTASSGLFGYIYYRGGTLNSSSTLAESNLVKLFPYREKVRTGYVRVSVVSIKISHYRT